MPGARPSAAGRPLDEPALAGAVGASGRPWCWRPAETAAAVLIAQRHGLPEAAARALAARGVGVDAVADFLAPRIGRQMPDPSCLPDMDAAAERIAAAILERRAIAIWADYDADGASAAALWLRFLQDRGGPPARLYVPDRLAEGYGLNAGGLARLAGEGVELVIAVDCGTNDHAAAAEAAARGLALVVVDHHPGDGQPLPGTVQVVNPNRPDATAEVRAALGGLAAAGVAFLTLVAVGRVLRRHGNDAGTDLLGLLDLVALGTVCDVVPLTGLNRAFVAQGLKVLARGGNCGLAALTAQAGLEGPPAAWHLGYVLGPRINAVGRLGPSDLAARLLASRQPAEAAALAAALDDWNRDRKSVEEAVLSAAAAQVSGEGRGVIAVAGEGWHPGIVGLIAGRLKERHQRPVLAVGWDGGEGRGSLRSVPGFDIGAAVAAARSRGLVHSGGGHAMAAGCTLARDALPGLVAALDDAYLADGTPEPPAIEIDGAVALGGLNEALVAALDRLAPYGAGNPEPRLIVPAVRTQHAGVVGERHVRCRLGDGAGGVGAIAFRATDSGLGRLLLDRSGVPLDIVGTVKRNTWQGRTRIELVIEDARPVWG